MRTPRSITRACRHALRTALAALALALVAASCGGDDAPEPDSSAASPQRPARIIALFDVNVGTLDAIGADHQLVAIDDFSEQPDDVSRLPRVGGDGFAFDVERIVGLRPDLVITSTGTEDVLDSRLEAAGIEVLTLPYPSTVKETVAHIRRLGGVTGRRASGKRIADRLATDIAALTKLVEDAHEPSVSTYYEGDASTPGKPYTVGPGSLIDELIGLAGGSNVFAKAATSAPQTSFEAVVAAKPDVIVLGNVEGYVGERFLSPTSVCKVATRPGFETVPAVRQRRVHPVHAEELLVPGPDLAGGLAELVAALHPELGDAARDMADLQLGARDGAGC